MYKVLPALIFAGINFVLFTVAVTSQNDDKAAVALMGFAVSLAWIWTLER